MNSQNVRINITRGIGIILMVLGHSHCPGTYYIYLFHMALFFILSGFCYKTEHTDSFNGLLRYFDKKVIRLYVPYVIFNTIFVIVDKVVFNSGIDTNGVIHLIKEGFFMNHGSTLSGAFWFFRIMLMLLITYGFIDYVLKKISITRKHTLIAHSVISVIFLAMGYYLSRRHLMLFGIERVMSYYILFHMGRIFKEKLTFSLNHLKRILIIAFCLVVLVICKRFGNIDLDVNQYVNPVFLLVTSIAGWFMVYELSYYFSLIGWTSKLLTVIGTNTMSVVIFHFLMFKGVNLIQIMVYDLSMEQINAFPVLINRPFWWMLYTLVGVTIPVGISLLYKRLIPHRK